VRAIARAPRVLALLAELYGRAPRPFQTLNFAVGTEQAPHADTIHFNSDPPTFLAGVWIALEDVDEDNGPVVYYPGSHRLTEAAPWDYGVPPGPDHYDAYEAFVAARIAEHGLEPRLATMARGQAFVWAGNLIHGGAPRRDPRRTRHSQVTHYYFAGCRYWTPLLSAPERRHRRRPRWVADRPRSRDRLLRRPWTP
jgi:ectoine hydroxylase-related dioxygenase (phytanoyl-CoA dioxygenase family)